MYCVGIVGHRWFSDQAASAFVAESGAEILRALRPTHPQLAVISALAEGADTLFAEVAVALGVPLTAVVPFSSYERDFETPQSLQRYRRLRAAAQCEHRLPRTSASPTAYQEAMQFVLDRSDLLVAAWNGQSARGPGGTAQAVGEAVNRGMPWIHLDVITRSVRRHEAVHGGQRSRATRAAHG